MILTLASKIGQTLEDQFNVFLVVITVGHGDWSGKCSNSLYKVPAITSDVGTKDAWGTIFSD